MREQHRPRPTLRGRSAGGRSADALLGLVSLGHRARALPGQLSGGELARAGLAVALAGDPAVLIADEPTGELDVGNERRVLALMRVGGRAAPPIVVASHSAEVAAGAPIACSGRRRPRGPTSRTEAAG